MLPLIIAGLVLLGVKAKVNQEAQSNDYMLNISDDQKSNAVLSDYRLPYLRTLPMMNQPMPGDVEYLPDYGKNPIPNQ